MITLRPTEERGHANLGWLDSHHTFSFGHYYDPAHMGFGPLRVINDDKVKPSKGFDTHGHKDMEIISYVVEGELIHKDNVGNDAVIIPGEVQRMSAGTGVRHSEFNHSDNEQVRFLQIWVLPDTDGLEPGYEQKYFGDERNDQLKLVASKNARDGSLKIHQDVDIYASVLTDQQRLSHSPKENRLLWVQVVKGTVDLNGHQLYPGDGAAIQDEAEITINATSDAEILLFDMAQLDTA